jgi:AraC family transcriptional regulator
VRHLGSDETVAEANQVILFNPMEGYRVSHPVPGGDACLDVVIGEPLLRELAPSTLLPEAGIPAFRRQRLRVDAQTQTLAALLRHRLHRAAGGGGADTLELESLALTLAGRALGPRTTHTPAAGRTRRRLVERTKLVLMSDVTRRWTLADLGAELGHSPVYLTQAFHHVEGMPLYRYQLRLRLARALDLLPQYSDLTSLALDLGFSSHSHFTTVFRQVYGHSPSAFRQSAAAAHP